MLFVHTNKGGWVCLTCSGTMQRTVPHWCRVDEPQQPQILDTIREGLGGWTRLGGAVIVVGRSAHPSANSYIAYTIGCWDHYYVSVTPSPNRLQQGFPQGTTSAIFQQWGSMGLSQIGQLFEDEQLLSSEELQEEFDLPDYHVFYHAQIAH